MVNITKIETLIKEKGWTKKFFSEQLGKNHGWIGDMKRGYGLPDENTLRVIADKLDTTVEYLTDKTEQKNKPTDNKVSGLRPELIQLKEITADFSEDEFRRLLEAAELLALKKKLSEQE